MIYPDLRDETLPPKNKLEEDLYASKSEPEAYVTAYVSKMFAVRASDLPENKKKTLTAEEMRARARELRLAREAAANADKAPTPEPISRAQSEAPAADDADETKEKEKDVEVILGFARLYSGPSLRLKGQVLTSPPCVCILYVRPLTTRLVLEVLRP